MGDCHANALLRYRYEGLSPSGLSVKGVRNDGKGHPPVAIINATGGWDFLFFLSRTDALIKTRRKRFAD